MLQHDILTFRRAAKASSAVVPLVRDSRIDLIRGLAVLAISANHIWYQGSGGHAWNGYKFGHVFAFDFSDVFVLLSGIVAGLVFFPLFMRTGFRHCCARSFRRAAQVWGAQIFCVLCALPIILVFEKQLGVTGSALSPFDRSTSAAFAGNLLLYRPSYLLDILPVYIMLLVALPFALVLFKRSPLLYFAILGSIWVGCWGTAFLDKLGAPVLLPAAKTPYFMHPLAAQFVFFTGVAIGIYKAKIEAFLTRHGTTIVPGVIVFLLVTNYMAQMEWIAHHFDRKHFAGPLRIAELLAVLAAFWSSTKPQFALPGLQLIKACGRHTLFVFAITSVGAVLLNYVAHWLDAGRLVYGLCIAANVGLCLVCGYVLEKRRAATHLQSAAKITLHKTSHPARLHHPHTA